MNDASFDWKNGLSFSAVMSSLLFCSIRIHDTIDMYVNYQKGEDVRGLMLSQKICNSDG